MILHVLLAGSLLVLPGGPSLPQEAPASHITVEPAEVRAGMFYSGTTLQVSADVPTGLEVSISCIGEEGPVELKKKGKVLGFIWMSVGDIAFDPLPNLYLVATSAPLSELADSLTLLSAGVGYEALEARAQPDDPILFQETLRFKESDGLYGIRDNGIRLGPGDPGSVRAEAEFALPAKAPSGEYLILVHGYGPEGSDLLAQERVTVVQTGAAALISNLAVAHGLAYGIVAVVFAVGVGLTTGVLFGLGSKKGH